MRRKFLKITLWTAAVLTMVFVGVVLLLLTAGAQTVIARYFLADFNQTIAGTISFRDVHISPPGWLELRDVSLTDDTDSLVAHLNLLRVRFEAIPLLRDSLHIRDVRIEELTLNIQVDSSGNSNLQRALAATRPAQSDTTPSKPLTWALLLDKAEIVGGTSRVELPELAPLEIAEWNLHLQGKFNHDSLDYTLAFNAPGMLGLDNDGSLVLDDPLRDITGALSVRLDSAFTALLPEPGNAIGALGLVASYETAGDSLLLKTELNTAHIGDVRAHLAVPFPPEDIAGQGLVTFEHVTPAALWNDTAYVEINGTVSFSKTVADNPVNGWMLDMDLGDCRYGEYALASASLRVRTLDSTISVQGNLDTGHGRLVLDGDLQGLERTTARVQADVQLSRFDLHHFISEVPDTLSPLSGRLTVQSTGLEPGTMIAQVRFNLDTVRLGRYELAAVQAAARMAKDSVFVDTMNIAAAGGTIGIQARAQLHDALEYSINAEMPDFANLRPFIAEYLDPADTVSGSFKMALSGSASLQGDSVSRITARGELRVTDARYAEYRVHKAHLQIQESNVDTLYLRGTLFVQGVQAVDQSIDSVQIEFAGTPDHAVVTPQIWARADTIRLATHLEYTRRGGDIEVAMSDLSAKAYGIAWNSEGTTTVALSENRVELDWLKFRSAVGVLSATGYIQQGGDQDFVLELSGIQTGELARIFKQDIPSSNTNIRLQVVGPDTALVGDISITADSISLSGMLLADQFYMSATAGRQGTKTSGFLIWFGDTLTTFSGELPARVSLEDGAVLVDSLPMQGHVRLLEQPLDKLNSYLPFGMSVGGSVSGDINFRGTPAQPDWAGVFAVRDGKYQDSRTGINYEKLNLTGDFERDTLRIRRFSAESEGTLKGTGWAVMAFPLPSELHLDVHLDNFEAINSPLMKIRADGGIAINGPMNRLEAQGRIQLNEVLYRITQAATKTIEEIDLEAELAKLSGDTAQPVVLLSEIYRSMSHELELEIPGNCWLRGGGMNIELSGQLWLYKVRDYDPTISGEIRVREGRVQFLGKEFIVDSDNSVVRYEGPIDNPTIDLQADYRQLEAKGILIHVHVYGSMA
ncbi:MAG: translocation/assembly module TamB domain-containing protein, partial [Calditrichota bacterium]